MYLLRKFINRNSLAVSLAVICFVVLLLSACGKRGDLYLPEEKAAVTSPAVEPVEEKKEKKKDEEQTQE